MNQGAELMRSDFTDYFADQVRKLSDKFPNGGMGSELAEFCFQANKLFGPFSGEVEAIGDFEIVGDRLIEQLEGLKNTFRNPSPTNDGRTPMNSVPEESEGNGGAGSTPEQWATASGATREATRLKLEPADQKAYYTYSYAESKLGTTTDQQAHKWLSDNGLPDEKDSPELAKALAGYRLPSFPTWSKQVRNARRALGEQKHTRRTGRSPGGSVLPASELDSQRAPD
jgi:hypothetical protein